MNKRDNSFSLRYTQIYNLLHNFQVFQALPNPWVLESFKNRHRQVRQKPKREFIKRSRLLKNRTHPVGRQGKSARGQRQTEPSMAQLVKFYTACRRNNFTSC